MARDSARSDIEAALARLLRGAPTHPDLVAHLAAGSLRINVSTVAKESGRSRTLIGLEDCAYPDLRMLVLKAAARSIPGRATSAHIKELAARIRELEQEIAVKDSAIAALQLTLAQNQSRVPIDEVAAFRTRKKG